MNIIVLGSNCKFSSDLSVKLNQLKDSSLILRYDVLSNFKKNVPLYSKIVSENKNILKEKQLENSFSVGNYAGDVEVSFYDSSINNKEVEKNIKTLTTIFNSINPSDTEYKDSFLYASLRDKIKECMRLSSSVESTTLNIINVFSGIMNKEMLVHVLSKLPTSLIIKVKGTKTLLPDSFEEKDLKETTKISDSSILLEVNSVDELLRNNFFKEAFNLKNIKEKKQKEETKACCTETPGMRAEGMAFEMPNDFAWDINMAA